ncbi:hypothetical protein V6x_54560 [Gimesia chilikensis]|uniref:Dual OB-containing domain-containing protein n=1 Tax=Gimesia chilikensis TaxID=2605989 RepID=A0A517WKD3_9PLAN|nr:hypothetical protein [Gimesia chilikensis]QDU05715.1 hypothetical protein V6x_54560 [Gimesia chilikensis]
MVEKTRIIITDLTRFKEGSKNVCTAGVTEDGTLIRPYPPYLLASDCERLDIHPGAILEGDFTPSNASPPHVEDANWENLNYVDRCSSNEFRDALKTGLFKTIHEGFEYDLPSGEKCIPIIVKPARSIITIKLQPHSFSIIGDSYNANKVRANFWDMEGNQFSFLPITDRGFVDQALKIQGNSSAIAKMNYHVQSQSELYLRIGLSRAYQAPSGKNGYWIQVNGIYTFPDYMDYIRCYNDKDDQT